MKNDDFCIFILTHGRPDTMITHKTLKKCGYTGRLFLVLDNEDTTIDKYYHNFGSDNIIIFDKKSYAEKVDNANNFGNRKAAVYARNFCFEAARKMGIKYFMQLDDDYYELAYKFEGIKGLALIKNLDSLLDKFIDYYKNAEITSIAFCQTGDFIGGINNGKGAYRFSKRKCMNSWICSTDKEFNFIGTLNDDVNAYITHGSRGYIFLTIPVVAVNQKDTQTQSGGMSNIYSSQGTYIKSFTTTMMHPSSVKVSILNSNHKRLHHSIKWSNTVPMIIRQEYKKVLYE